MEVGDTASAAGRPMLLLALGVVVLEFAAAVSTFVASTLLPLIEHDLHAQRALPLLVSGTTIGMFTALPLAPRLIALATPQTVLTAGFLVSVLGSAVAATSTQPLVFAFGRFLAGLAGAVMAVYGVSAAIEHLDERLRLRVMSAMSAMWILPALVGPSLTVGLEHLIGWRWTLLLPTPLAAAGRGLVVHAVPPQRPTRAQEQPLGRTLLVPVGVTAFVLLSGSRWWPVSPVAAVLAVVGFLALMPDGTARLRRGAPAALAGLTLFGFAYFGADSLVTVLLTSAYHASLTQAGMVLSAAPLAWGLTALVVPRLGKDTVPPALALGLTAVGLGVVAFLAVVGGSWVAALCCWALGGVGVGLAYPVLYLRGTTPDGSTDSVRLATAVLTTESFGGLIGSSLGAAMASLSAELHVAAGTALACAYVAFACALAVAAAAAARSSPVPR